MMRRRSIHLAAGLATLVAPLAALAQIPTGSVTTDPVQQAPALGMSVIVVLAVAMAGVGVYRLRRTVAGRIVGFVLVAAATVLAGLVYAVAPATIMISGADCTMRTTNAFDPLEPNMLMSDCSNLIRIVDIQVSCDAGMSSFNSAPTIAPPADCSVGQTLANGGACGLPSCVPD
jgi:apolipoprotein N-acyltransferase